MFDIEQMVSHGAKIKVVGVGGSGCNAINTMIRSGLEGVEFVTANTDKQALDISLAPTKLAIGQELTKGLGAGANPEIGRKAALEDYAKITEILTGADMVFITAGMGGGTGTGAAPIFAKIAKEIGALTVGVVTKPFSFEGKKRMRHAEHGMACLRESVDSLITIPNQRLLALSGTTLSIVDAFKKADEVLLNAVQGISDLINHTGLINSDFADVKTIMQNKGLALMGIGYGEGEHRALEAATNAISSPLLEDISIDGATGIIINITGGSNLKIHEVNEATTLIMEAAHEDAEIIFGTVIDEAIKDVVKVTVIATGLGGAKWLSQGVVQTAGVVNTMAPHAEAQPSQHAVQAPQFAPSVHQPQPNQMVQQPMQYAAAPQAHVHAPQAQTYAPVHAPMQAPQQQMVPAAPVQQVPVQAQYQAQPQQPAYVTPPEPNASMLANNAAVLARVQAAKAKEAEAEDELFTEPELQLRPAPQPMASQATTQSAPNLAALANAPMGAGAEGGELARARVLAQRLGITNLTDDEYDIPTYMRRQQEREV